MSVGELIAKLAELPQDLPVVVSAWEECSVASEVVHCPAGMYAPSRGDQPFEYGKENPEYVLVLGRD